MTLACAAHDDGVVPSDLEGVAYVDDLCRKPGDLTSVIGGADRVVMIVHRGDMSVAQVQQSLRKAGVDPFGVQYVTADAIGGDARRATVLLGGARARVAAYTESRPEHARATFGGPRSRRQMLSIPQPRYEPMPRIDLDQCVAGDGCRACVVECPQTAYRWAGGNVHFDREACVTCGRCITVCPVGAIDNPAISNEALLDQITALVDGMAPDPVGIAFVCRQRSRSISSQTWAEVEVPCTGMVPATWPIAALLLGAGGAAVVTCSSSGCGLANDEKAAGTVELAGTLLTGAGWDAAVVSDSPGELGTSVDRQVLNDPFGVHGPAEVALALQAVSRSGDPILASGRMAFRGVATIDMDACTLCLACAETCPPGALVAAPTPGQVAVTFDAALCTGCSQCVGTCPEAARGAISVDQRIDTVELGAGRYTLAESPTTRCELCGEPIASAAMLSRLADLLGKEHDAAMAYLERRCMNCRGAS